MVLPAAGRNGEPQRAQTSAANEIDHIEGQDAFAFAVAGALGATALIRSRKRTFYYAPTEIPTDDPLLQQPPLLLRAGRAPGDGVPVVVLAQIRQQL